MEIKCNYTELRDLATIVGNPRNTNKHSARQIELLAKIINYQGWRHPIIISNLSGFVVAGHGRLEAAKKLGYTQAPVEYQDFENPAQEYAFLESDNHIAELAEHDKDLMLENLKDFDIEDFELLGFDDFKIDLEEMDYGKPDENQKGSLAHKWGVPPFSVLDTKQGYWQDRKNAWLAITGDLTETKENVLGDSMLSKINDGSSNFDPVLAELMFKWFNLPNGHILDPFGGEQTKGVVAGELGMHYTAVEFRDAQVVVNKEKTKQYENVNYFCGDSNNISNIVHEREFDFCFTSPPYYDLEVYSKDDMSALGTYEEFMQQYKNIFTQCYNMLADNRFLAIKIGEIRNKKTGEYRNFVGDNIQMFKDIGFKYYNEIALINCAGTAPLRANRTMQTRKVVKLHQNVLVFYKGNLDLIKGIYTHDDGITEISE